MTLKGLLVDPTQQDAAAKIFDVLQGTAETTEKSYPHPHYGRPGKRGGSTSRAAYAALEKEGRHWTPKRRGVKRDKTGDDKTKPVVKPKPTKPKKTEPKPKPKAEKPATRKAADVRKEIVDVSSKALAIVKQHQQETEKVLQELRQVQYPSSSDFASTAEFRAAREAFLANEQALFEKIGELRRKSNQLMEEASAEVRKKLYVDKPIRVEPEIKRRFSSREKKQSVLDALTEFTKMVGIPVAANTVDVLAAGKRRAHYTPGSKAISIGAQDGGRVIVHEMGHWLEDVSPEVHKKAVDFLMRRTGDEPVRSLRQLTGQRYRSNEVTRPDKFIHPYIGKNYIHNGNRYATEVISMGLEYMYSEPWKLATEDPDMFDFIYDVVRGQ